MNERKVRRYMRLAKFIGEDDNPCFSRQIGAVITTADGRRILGTGYNGPPPGTPHTDDYDYITDFLWLQLTEEDKQFLRDQASKNGVLRYDCQFDGHTVWLLLKNKKICPRRYLGIPSGERTTLCTCGHAERHAITNAACDLIGAVMFCWCSIPCLQCADAIIQSGIKLVHCLNGEEYNKGTSWLFEKAGVKIRQHAETNFT